MAGFLLREVAAWAVLIPLSAFLVFAGLIATGALALVGPKPYLRFDVPSLLLPGIDGLTEQEVMQLFGVAYEMHGR